jgi:YfiH family protein
MFAMMMMPMPMPMPSGRMLPHPDDRFRWVQSPGGPALVCRALEPVAAHLFTTRQWQLGSAPAGHRDDAWADVAAAMGVASHCLSRAHQVHGATVIAQPGRDARMPEGDIIIGIDAAFALAIQVADCVPLLVADRRTRAVAAAHAGWRGMAAGVPHLTVAALGREFGSRPEDLIAAIGPSIGACCYEVGADVRSAFATAGFDDRDIDRWFTVAPQPSETNPSMPGLSHARRPDHWFFDGWAATRHQLERAGVPASQIHAASLCSASHPQAFCSYRRDGRAAGRMAAAIRPAAAIMPVVLEAS